MDSLLLADHIYTGLNLFFTSFTKWYHFHVPNPATSCALNVRFSDQHDIILMFQTLQPLAQSQWILQSRDLNDIIIYIQLSNLLRTKLSILRSAWYHFHVPNPATSCGISMDSSVQRSKWYHHIYTTQQPLVH